MTTATHLGDMTIEKAATDAAGNWQEFDSFAWWRKSEVESPNDWLIHYTHNRDSGLLDQSNAAQISEALEQFTDGDDPDVVEESHNHWAVGYVDGFSLRVFRDGKITEAFRTFHELMERLAIYPILNEDDYSRREYEATVENIGQAARQISDEYELPEHWEYEVYGWLSDNDCGELESRSDQGGWPSEEALRTAMDELFDRVIEE